MNKLVDILPRRVHLWIVLLFVILPLLAFPEIIFGGRTLYWTDLTWIHYPRRIFAAEEWLAGRVPLWDPYEDTGIPLLAEAQVGVLYPLSVIFLSSLSPSLELSLFILIHFSLAAFFTFILARSLGLSLAAATVAGLAYGCGGFLMAQVPNLNIMTGAVWLPLILYAAVRALRRRSWAGAMAVGLPLALQISTAQPQIVFYTLVILFGYGLYRIAADFLGADDTALAKGRQAVQSGLLLGTMIVTGLLLAAPQLLPTLELQQLSVRSQERGLDFLTENSLPPLMLLNLLLPGGFGNNVTGFKGGDPFQEVFIYVGFTPLLLAGFSWAQRRKRDVLFFYGLLIVALLLALGGHTPLYESVVRYLPGFALFRIPSRWLMGVNLALAVLAGCGLETLRQKGLSRRALTVLTAVWLALMVAVVGIWFFKADLPAWSGAYLGGFQQRLMQAAATKAFSLDATYRETLWFGGLAGLRAPGVLLITNIIISAGLFTLLAAKRISFNTFAILVIGAVSLDLVAAGGTTINPTKPDDWWGRLSGGAVYVLDHVGEARVFPLGMGSEEATVSHLGQYFPSVYRVPSAGGHGSSLLNARYSTFLDEADPVQAVQVVGVRYLLTLGRMGPDVAATYPLAYSDETSFVYENKNPLPRAFVAHNAIRVSGPAEALALLQGRSFDPAQTVVLETETALPPLPASLSPSPAIITNHHPQLVEIETVLQEAGYLVLLDTYYPGWTATVDGRPAAIYPANYIGRAVFVPAGAHRVRFTYQPLFFRIGVGLALLTTIVLAATAFGARKIKIN